MKNNSVAHQNGGFLIGGLNCQDRKSESKYVYMLKFLCHLAHDVKKYIAD